MNPTNQERIPRILLFLVGVGFRIQEESIAEPAPISIPRPNLLTPSTCLHLWAFHFPRVFLSDSGFILFGE